MFCCHMICSTPVPLLASKGKHVPALCVRENERGGHCGCISCGGEGAGPKEDDSKIDLGSSFTIGGFIKGILRWVRCTKSLRVLFLHRRPPSWTTLVLYSRAVFIFNEPALYSFLDVMCTVCCRGGCVQYTCIGGEGGQTNEAES